MTVHAVRDWRGIKTQLGRCTNSELVSMLEQSAAVTEQIAHFVAEVEAELASRGGSPSRPCAVA